MNQRPAFALLVWVFAAASCGYSGDALTLDVGEDRLDDPRYRELRERLDVDVHISLGEGALEPPKGCEYGHCSLATFDDIVGNECNQRVLASTRCANALGCPEAACLAERDLCAAHLMLEVATSASGVQIAAADGTQVVVPAQDAETNAELSRLAFLLARDANRGASLELLGPSGGATYCSGADLSVTVPARAVDGIEPGNGEVLANFFVESYDVAIEASRHMTTFSAAVSEAQSSRFGQPADAQYVATTAPVASRAAAAHLLVGGTDGLPGFGTIIDETGIFPVAPLSDGGRRALALMREAGLRPEFLRSGITTDQLVAGFYWNDSPEIGIAGRLGQLHADADLSEEGITASAAYSRLGLGRSDFVAAREYLVSEGRAFMRSQTQLVAGEHSPNGDVVDFQVYAATRSQPRALPDTAVAALYAFQSEPKAISGGSPYPWQPLIPQPSPGGAKDESGIVTVAAFRHGAEATVTAAIPGVPAIPADILGAWEGVHAGDVRGRLQGCFLEGGSATDRLSLHVYGARAASDLLLVNGPSGISCATTGIVDGAPCALEDYLAATWPAPPSVPAGHAYATHADTRDPLFREYVEAWVNVDDMALEGYARPTVFVGVVQRRAGRTTSNPGDFEEFGALLMTQPSATAATGSYSGCVNRALTVDEHAAATAANPSPEDPSVSAVTCAGLSREMLIPLENELTDDGNGVESSWRRYLALARTAADEADLLGEDLIRTGLESDLRAEGAIDELQRICGVAINITSLADLETSPRTITPYGSGASCADGYRGVPSTPPYTSCVLDPVAFARAHAATSQDAARLDACLGDDVTVPWTTYGTTPLCIWHYPGVANSVCRGAAEGHPCPTTADTADGETLAACDGISPPAPIAGVAAEVQLVWSRLGLFVTPGPDDEIPTGYTNEFDCDELARRRVGNYVSFVGFGTFVASSVLNSSLADPVAMRGYAQELEWFPYAGDFSRVTLNGVALASTGSPSGGVDDTVWPCGDPGATCQTGPGFRQSLFCMHDACGGADDMSQASRVARATTNDLLARAVLAARIVTGASLSGLQLPYRPALNHFTDSTSFDVQGTRWTTPRGASEFQSSAVGSLAFDRSGDGPLAHSAPFSDLQLVAQRIAASDADCAGRSLQWLHCDAYGGSSCPYAFEGDGCGMPNPAPFMVYTLGDDLDGSDVGTVVGRMWRRARPGDPAEAGAVFDIFTHPRGDPARMTVLQNAALTRYGTEPGSLYGASGSWDYFAIADLYRQQGFDYYSAANELAIGDVTPLVMGDGASLTDADVANGLESLCAGARLSSPNIFDGCTEVPDIDSVQDMMGAAEYVTCQRDAIRRMAANGLVRDLPVRVVDALRDVGPGVFGEEAGEFGAEVTELSAALIDLRTAELAMADSMGAMATEMRSLNIVIQRSAVAHELEDLGLASQVLDRLTNCAAGLAGAGAALAGAGFAYASAGVQCANDFAQIGIATRVHDLRDQGATLDEELAFANFDMRITSLTSGMAAQAVAVQSSQQRIDAALTRIHNLGTEGRVQLARALMLDDDGMGRQMSTDTVTRRRYSTVLNRYREAHARAVRLAYIGRVALEQRLGMPLTSMTADLATVDAPAGWADEICTIPSIDYDRIRDADLGTLGGRADDGSPFAAPVDYSGLYLGDYVRRLEQVFESYSFAYPFHDGTDTAVLSLRDDVMRTRALCAAGSPGAISPNLLLQSGHLDQMRSTSRPGWQIDGCDPLETWPTDAAAPDRPSCVDPAPIDLLQEAMGYEYPIAGSGSEFDRPPLFRVQFGVESPPVVAGVPRQSVTADTRLIQWIDVPAGAYRVSWFARPTPGASPAAAIDPKEAVRAVRLLPGGAGIEEPLELAGTRLTTPIPAAEPPAVLEGWVRGSFMFRVATSSTVGIYVSPELGAGLPRFRTIDIAALMVDDASVIPSGATASTLRPGPFFDTKDTRARLDLWGCEDTDGLMFRRALRYDCTRSCPDGYDGTCPDEVAGSRCFWELALPVSLEDLGDLVVGTPAGFAHGNYNYRFETVGLNFVGTGLRDCSRTGTPSTCYSSGGLSYSILHTGPYVVRNARGEDYEAPLFAGRIEGARGLAAERYLTNPLSAADRSLIQEWMRPELQGRPIGGGLTIRVWDDADVEFANLEDIQLVLDYRYWQQQR